MMECDQNEPLTAASETTPLLASGPPSNQDSEAAGDNASRKRGRRLAVLMICIVNFCAGAVYSNMSPFYPSEAIRKHTGMTVVGMILGVIELSFMISSPIFGSYLTQIGAKFMFCAGVMGCGLSATLFGFVDEIRPGTTYIAMCFVVRIFEGISAAAFATASFSILAFTFPDRVAAMIGVLEVFSGLGMMLGPPLGGVLFQVGGFRLPFFTTGILLFVTGCLGMVLLRSYDGASVLPGGSMFSLARLPIIWLLGYGAMVALLSVGFLDVNLSVHINDTYKLKPAVLGLIFLTSAAFYGIGAPLWGLLADKWVEGRYYLLIAGFFLVGVAFWCIAPLPFLFRSQNPLWVLIVSAALGGFGLASSLITFSEINTVARNSGHPDTLETYGLVSGIFNFFTAFGAFLGPIFGGFLVELWHFAWACTAMGIIAFTVSAAIIIYKLIAACWGSRPLKVNVEVTESIHDSGNSCRTSECNNET